MKRTAVFLCLLFMCVGCSRQETSVSSSASFDPQRNKGLSGRVVSTGALDKEIVIEGTADSVFRVTFEVSWKEAQSSTSIGADMLFQWKDNKLSPFTDDYRQSGGGE